MWSKWCSWNESWHSCDCCKLQNKEEQPWALWLRASHHANTGLAVLLPAPCPAAVCAFLSVFLCPCWGAPGARLGSCCSQAVIAPAVLQVTVVGFECGLRGSCCDYVPPVPRSTQGLSSCISAGQSLWVALSCALFRPRGLVGIHLCVCEYMCVWLEYSPHCVS